MSQVDAALRAMSLYWRWCEWADEGRVSRPPSFEWLYAQYNAGLFASYPHRNEGSDH